VPITVYSSSSRSDRVYQKIVYDPEGVLNEATSGVPPHREAPSVVWTGKGASWGRLYIPRRLRPPKRALEVADEPLGSPKELVGGIEAEFTARDFLWIGLGYLTPSPREHSPEVSPFVVAPKVGHGAEPRGQEPLLLPLIQQAIDAFENDLPRLLESHRGQWVVYRGEERLDFGTSKTALLQTCYARGYPDEDLYVRRVEECAPNHFAW